MDITMNEIKKKFQPTGFILAHNRMPVSFGYFHASIFGLYVNGGISLAKYLTV